MFQIRAAVGDDVDAVTAVYVACFNAPPWNDGWSFEGARERLQGYMETRFFRGAIAVADGAVVGLLVGQKERWVRSYHFLIQEMCVLPEQQRKGIGKALLSHVSEELGREGTEKMFLITGPDTPAAAFYAAHRFYPSRARQVMVCPIANPSPV